jgi:CHAP domain
MLRPLVVMAALGLAVFAGPVEALAAPKLGARISARATRLVGVSSLKQVDRSVPDDCTGVARIAYESVGIELMAGPGRTGSNGVSHIYQYAKRLGAVHKGRPQPGDLVFFRETYDRDRDGRRDDGLTHVGIVEKVAPDGTITFVHRGSKGVARARMDLRHPTLHRVRGSGAVVNDYLRRASKGSRAYLTGELFAGFASPGPLARAARAAPRR